jgi:relaxase-like protein
MIPRLLPAGRSFRGLALYLGRDPKADTAHRVAWTHTLNCAHDHVPSAVHEMYSTALEAELLKQEAGIRQGGRTLEKPVKHFSLNWHPSQEPTREEMLATAQSFLKHMGWQEHQAILFAHDDKEHCHLHCMLNVVHPETGLKLDDGLEKRRMAQWALAYEREQGRIFCEQRLMEPEDRVPSPTRAEWLALKEAERQHQQAEEARRAYDPDYLAREENRRVIEGEEWKILKGHQRQEREAFFTEGKGAFTDLRTAIYREVREEFREEWSGYYATKRQGGDTEELAAMRADILERQKAALDERRAEACGALRERRDGEYAELLAGQKEMRAELAARQEQGLGSPGLLDRVNGHAGREADHDSRPEGNQPGQESFRSAETGRADHDHAFQAAADETCRPASDRGETTQDWWPEEMPGMTSAENPRVRDGANVVGDLGMGMIGALATIGERFFDGFLGSTPPQGNHNQAPTPAPAREPQAETPRAHPFAKVAAAARQSAERQEEEQKNRAYWEERERVRE